MVARFRQIQRARICSNQAHKSFANAQGRLVHGITVEAFSCVEFQRTIRPQRIDGTNLCHHIRRNQAGDLIQSFLRAN